MRPLTSYLIILCTFSHLLFGQGNVDTCTIIQPIIQQLDTKLSAPQEGDWLYSNHERAQSLASFKRDFGKNSFCKKAIYLQLFGNFTASEDSIIKAAVTYLSVYYATSVITEKTYTSIKLHKSNSRKLNKEPQVMAKYLLYNYLFQPKASPRACTVGITSWDLYSDLTANYIFGEADASNQVAIVSIKRLFDATASDSLALERLIKNLSHEINHTLGLEHCASQLCNMNGNNHLAELDLHPNYLCSTCTAKLCSVSCFNQVARLRDLYNYFSAQNNKVASSYYLSVLQALGH
jgi:predicted Zn-dependent protease